MDELARLREIRERPRNGDWIQTYTGRQFWPLDPRADEVDIQDIAHALSNLCRFTGHCAWFYSVAQHSVLVSRACDPADALAGLLHDAAEAYVADLPRPIKRQPGMEAYRDAEALVHGAIGERFGVAVLMPPSVVAADEAVLATEGRDLMKRIGATWNLRAAPLPGTIAPWSSLVARHQFLRRFHCLRRDRG